MQISARTTEGWSDSFKYRVAEFFSKKDKETMKTADTKDTACKVTQTEKQPRKFHNHLREEGKNTYHEPL